MTGVPQYGLFPSVSKVFWWNKLSKKKYRVNQGGTSSGKTYSLVQNMADLLAFNDRTKGTVTATELPSIKSGPLTDFKNILDESPMLQALITNPDSIEGPFRFTNGSELEFRSFDTPGKAKKAGKRDYLLINEGNEMEWEICDHLMTRTRKVVFVDFNADTRFWAHKELVEAEPDKTEYIISNYTHNPFLDRNTTEDIERYLRRYFETGREYWLNKWKVYGMGMTGSVEGTIFSDNVFPIDFFPDVQKHGYGLDFGYTNDPTALAECGVKFGNIYGRELLYETDLYSDKLADRMEQIGVRKDLPIIADRADLSSIRTLKNRGFKVIECDKWSGSVTDTIDFLRSKNINIMRDSVNWWNEADNYKWKKDRDGGYLNKPIDKYDHLWQALGYWGMKAYGHTSKPKKKPHKRTINVSYKSRFN